MKTSRRLLLGTFVAMLATPVALVAYTRFSGSGFQDFQESPPPERTAPAAIAALRDFTEIEISGDFSLEIVRADSFAIEYTPIADNRGAFTALVRDGVLNVEGFGNNTEFAMATVRISLPDLTALDIRFVPVVTVRGFEGDSLKVDVNFAENIVIENSRFGEFDLEIQGGGLVEFRGNTFGSSRVQHFGTTITTD